MSQKFTEFTLNNSNASINVELIRNFKNAYKINDDIKIITMVGVARSGKSAFLNCLVTKICGGGKSHSIFQSMSLAKSDGKDVTNGMNGCLIDKTLFLDVQGIAGERSECDPILLLFCYYISDIIIFNIDKQLNTQALNLLTPIAAKLQNMKDASKLHKPKLVFRVYDCVDDYDDELARKNFTVMMTERDDQVQGIRKAINELFVLPNRKIVWTERPSKKDLAALEKGDVAAFLAAENNFSEACGQLYEIIAATSIRKSYNFASIMKHATIINEQAGVFKSVEFDLATTINNQEIRWWIEGDKYGQHADKVSQIPGDLRQALAVNDCTQPTWEVIQTRSSQVDSLIDSFKLRFNKSPSNLRDAGLAELEKIVMPPVNNAMSQFDGFAKIEQNKIEKLIKDELSTIAINDHQSFIANDVWLTTVNKHITGRPIAAHITEEIKETLTQFYDVLLGQHKIVHGEYLKRYEAKIKTAVSSLNNCSKNLPNLLNPYISQLELSYQQICKILLDQYQKDNQITVEESTVQKVWSYLFGSGAVDESKSKTTLTVETRSFSIEWNSLKLEYSASSDKVIEINTAKELESSLAKLQNAMKTQSLVFNMSRAAAIPKLLEEINKQPFGQRCATYVKIAHNNLYMFDFPASNNQKANEYELFQFRNFINTHIMNEEQFRKHFSPKVQKLYAICKDNSDPTYQTWARSTVWNVHLLDSV